MVSKTILKAEKKRLEEIIHILDKSCPVCKAQDKIKKKPYWGENCSSCSCGENTACSPKGQKRCKTILLSMDKMLSILIKTRNEVTVELEELDK